MSATFTCPSCGRQGSIKREMPAGAKLRCPECQVLFSPQPAREAVPAAQVSESQVEAFLGLTDRKPLPELPTFDETRTNAVTQPPPVSQVQRPPSSASMRKASPAWMIVSAVLLLCLGVVSAMLVRDRFNHRPPNPVSGEQVTSKTVEPSDPVSAFKKVVDEVTARGSKGVEYIQKCVSEDCHPDYRGKWARGRSSWVIIGYDVKQTDSLVSPYEGVIEVMEIREDAYNDIYQSHLTNNAFPFGSESEARNAKVWVPKGYKPRRKVTYNWVDGHWTTRFTLLPFGERFVFDGEPGFIRVN